VIVHGINYPGTKIGDAIVEKPGLEQPRYYWDPVIAPSGLVFYRGDLFPQWKTSVLVGGLAAQAIFRLELDKDDKAVNEEPLLTDLDQRIRDVRVFQDGAVYVQSERVRGHGPYRCIDSLCFKPRGHYKTSSCEISSRRPLRSLRDDDS